MIKKEKRMSEHNNKQVQSLPLEEAVSEEYLATASGGGLKGLKAGFDSAYGLGGNKVAQVKSAVYGLIHGNTRKTALYSMKQADKHKDPKA
jgi:hypothetical protein